MMKWYWLLVSQHVDGKQRPMVARLMGKQILEVLDLSTSPQKTIQSLESLSGYEHRLEDLDEVVRCWFCSYCFASNLYMLLQMKLSMKTFSNGLSQQERSIRVEEFGRII